MEMGAEIFMLRELSAEVIGHGAGLKRAETYPGIGRGGTDGRYHGRGRGLAGQIEAVRGYLYAGYDDLAIALCIQPCGLAFDLCHRHRAGKAAGIGNEAVGAEVLAAVLYLEKGAGAAVKASGRHKVKVAAVKAGFDAAYVGMVGVGLLDKLDDAALVGRAADDIGAAELADLIRLYLCIAAADNEDAVGVEGLCAAGGVAAFTSVALCAVMIKKRRNATDD